jgi:hypothetical protein
VESARRAGTSLEVTLTCQQLLEPRWSERCGSTREPSASWVIPGGTASAGTRRRRAEPVG